MPPAIAFERAISALIAAIWAPNRCRRSGWRSDRSARRRSRSRCSSGRGRSAGAGCRARRRGWTRRSGAARGAAPISGRLLIAETISASSGGLLRNLRDRGGRDQVREPDRVGRVGQDQRLDLRLQALHVLDRREHVVLEDVDLGVRLDDVGAGDRAAGGQARVGLRLRAGLAQAFFLDRDVAPGGDEVVVRVRDLDDACSRPGAARRCSGSSRWCARAGAAGASGRSPGRGPAAASR